MVRPPGTPPGIRVHATDDADRTNPAPRPLSTPLGPPTGLPGPRAPLVSGGLLSVRARPRLPKLPDGVASAAVGVPGVADARPVGRVVLMGGGAEDDDAARSFVAGAGGGDVVVLRASGSTSSYNDYFFADLAADPRPSSVATLRIDESSAGGHPGVVDRVDGAGALWLAGGDQHRYLSWPAPLIAALDRVGDGRTIGGTSAGAMSLGAFAFDAAEGGVRSPTALEAPADAIVSIVKSPFARAELADHLVDTHFSERDREGRLITFLARAKQQFQIGAPRGVGIDEGTALVIEGDRYEVRGRGDVFVYELAGDVTVEVGRPLEARGVRRARLSNGDRGAWPIETFEDSLEVKRGQISEITTSRS